MYGVESNRGGAILGGAHFSRHSRTRREPELYMHAIARAFALGVAQANTAAPVVERPVCVPTGVSETNHATLASTRLQAEAARRLAMRGGAANATRGWNEIFDHMYLINLERRSDRASWMRQLLERTGASNVERMMWPAVDLQAKLEAELSSLDALAQSGPQGESQLPTPSFPPPSGVCLLYTSPSPRDS